MCGFFYTLSVSLRSPAYPLLAQMRHLPRPGESFKGRALGKPVLAIGFRPAGSFAAGLRGFVSVFERMCNCGMKSEHLVGTNIPRFTYDTPTVPENDFYARWVGSRPL